MNRLHQILLRFFHQEDGPTAVEYAVMLALIIVICLAAIGALGERVHLTFDEVLEEGFGAEHKH